MNFDEFNEIDKALKDLEISHKGIDLRYFLRDEIIYQIRKRKGEGNQKIKIDLKLKKRLLKGIFLTVRNFFLRKKIWVISNSDRRKKINGYYVDRVASVITDLYPKETLFIESNTVTQHKKPTKDLILSESILQFLAKLFILVNKKKILSFQRDFSNLKKQFNVPINIDSQILKFFGQYYAMTLFLKIKKKPKIIFLVYPSGYLGYIKRFKELKINLVELQHGVIYKEHPSYNSKLTYKNNLKPDYIFTYGNKDKQVLNELKFLPYEKIISTGAYLASYCKEIKIDESDYLKNIIDKRYSLVIVATSTLSDTEELLMLCNNLAKENSNFLFLLLPRSDSFQNEKITEDNFKLLNPNKTFIYELLIRCDVHITQVSTCALEALFFNKKSLVYENERFLSFYRKNYDYIKGIEYFSSVEEFKSLVSIPFEKDNNNIDLLFDKEFSVKVSKNIRKILNN